MSSKVMLFGMILAALVTGCGNKAETPPPAARIVKAMTIGAEASAPARSFGGDVRARHETLVGFRVGGKIAERLVDVGTVVKPGQPLARLDVSDIALRAIEAEAQSALSAADAKRYRDLHAKNFVSQAAVDARDTAQQAAGAQAALARNQASYATLMADHAGVVAEVLAQSGQVVAAGQGVFRLAWEGEREVAISIPEDAVAAIKVGTGAEISLWSAPGKIWRGRVREVAPVANAATRTYDIRVSIVDAVPPPLGMSASVSFSAIGVDTLVVPMTSLYQQGAQPAVWIIDKGNKLTLRPVRVASYSDGGARITGGLVTGERIVAAGASRLQAGEVVSISDSTR